MNLKKAIIFLTCLFWPLSLYLTNTWGDFLKYLIPLLLGFTGYLLYKKGSNYYGLPLILIPFIEPKLSLFPSLFLITDLVFSKKEKVKFLLCVASLLTLLFQWKLFYGQSIFVPDYEARQEVVRDTHLYNSVFIARLFHNKARVIFDKFSSNFFAMSDPNNYFFGFHPRQIIGNQNLIKFPFLAVIIVLVGIYTINKKQKFLIIYAISAIISLSLLSLFDRNDFILFLPTLLILDRGINLLSKKRWSSYFFFIYLIFSATELIRLFYIYPK